MHSSTLLNSVGDPMARPDSDWALTHGIIVGDEDGGFSERLPVAEFGHARQPLMLMFSQEMWTALQVEAWKLFHRQSQNSPWYQIALCKTRADVARAIEMLGGVPAPTAE